MDEDIVGEKEFVENGDAVVLETNKINHGMGPGSLIFGKAKKHIVPNGSKACLIV